MPQYVILSPLEYPIAYAAFGLAWGSSVIGILVSLYFYRSKKEAWWLLLAFALATPLISVVAYHLSRGQPIILPYGLRTIVQTSSVIPIVGTTTIVELNWDPLPPLTAIALFFAYLADRKRRDDGPTNRAL